MTAQSNIPAWDVPQPIETRRRWQHRQHARQMFVRKHLNDGADVQSLVSLRGLAALAKNLKLWREETSIDTVADDLLVLIEREQEKRRQADLKRGKSPA